MVSTQSRKQAPPALHPGSLLWPGMQNWDAELHLCHMATEMSSSFGTFSPVSQLCPPSPASPQQALFLGLSVTYWKIILFRVMGTNNHLAPPWQQLLSNPSVKPHENDCLSSCLPPKTLKSSGSMGCYPSKAQWHRIPRVDGLGGQSKSSGMPSPVMCPKEQKQVKIPPPEGWDCCRSKVLNFPQDAQCLRSCCSHSGGAELEVGRKIQRGKA